MKIIKVAVEGWKKGKDILRFDLVRSSAATRSSLVSTRSSLTIA